MSSRESGDYRDLWMDPTAGWGERTRREKREEDEREREAEEKRAKERNRMGDAQRRLASRLLVTAQSHQKTVQSRRKTARGRDGNDSSDDADRPDEDEDGKDDDADNGSFARPKAPRPEDRARRRRPSDEEEPSEQHKAARSHHPPRDAAQRHYRDESEDVPRSIRPHVDDRATYEERMKWIAHPLAPIHFFTILSWMAMVVRDGLYERRRVSRQRTSLPANVNLLQNAGSPVTLYLALAYRLLVDQVHTGGMPLSEWLRVVVDRNGPSYADSDGNAADQSMRSKCWERFRFLLLRIAFPTMSLLDAICSDQEKRGSDDRWGIGGSTETGFYDPDEYGFFRILARLQNVDIDEDPADPCAVAQRVFTTQFFSKHFRGGKLLLPDDSVGKEGFDGRLRFEVMFEFAATAATSSKSLLRTAGDSNVSAQLESIHMADALCDLATGLSQRASRCCGPQIPAGIAQRIEAEAAEIWKLGWDRGIRARTRHGALEASFTTKHVDQLIVHLTDLHASMLRVNAPSSRNDVASLVTSFEGFSLRGEGVPAKFLPDEPVAASAADDTGW